MADPQALEAIRQGVSVWNDWKHAQRQDLRNADLHGEELTGVDLQNTNLAGANLRGANLTTANFGEADLTGADLGEARLADAVFQATDRSYRVGEELIVSVRKGANLTDANLERTDLRGARFGEPGTSPANLYQTRLRESNLTDCDLSRVTGGLRPQQLAGANLTGARLPEPLSKLFNDLKAVGDISESARKLFLVTVAACLYSWLTIAATTDVNLITNRASSPLPIIQTSIPIVGFYLFAPLLLLCVYFYFHFYLQKLWEELGSLPAIFPDGRRLHERSDPWLLNDLVRSHVAELMTDRPFMSYFQQAISMVLAWWLVPVTLFMFWGRYLYRHDLYGTTLQVVLLAISITAAVRLYRLAAATLRGAERRSFSGIRTLKTVRAYGVFAMFVFTGVVLMFLSVGAIRGVAPDNFPHANLRQAELSIKPPNWTSEKKIELDLVKGAELNGADLGYAEADSAFLAKADLAEANLTEAHLGEADLTRAYLRGSHLTKALLGGAHLSGADLSWADLSDANLEDADLTGVRLGAARLEGADLIRVHLANAELQSSHLSGAHLDVADLTKANLRGAVMDVATLSDANLTEADLTDAHLASADLTGARLTGANLAGADFRSDDRYGIFEHGAVVGMTTKGLTAAAIKEAKNWEKAYYDGDVLGQLGLPSDHNQKLESDELEKQRKVEEFVKRHRVSTDGVPPTAQQAAPSPNPPGKAKSTGESHVIH